MPSPPVLDFPKLLASLAGPPPADGAAGAAPPNPAGIDLRVDRTPPSLFDQIREARVAARNAEDGQVGAEGDGVRLSGRGAPIAAWATFPLASVTWSGAPRRVRASSAIARRSFCGECGSALTWEGETQPGEIDLAVGAFDDNTDLAPDFHLWCEARPPWFDTTDDKKRYRRSSKDGG